MSRKTLTVASAILERVHARGDLGVTPMQLIKLVYIAHGYMLGTHGRPLLDESVVAWKFGPVVPSVYHAVKHYGGGPVKAVPMPHRVPLDDDEIGVINKVADTYGHYNGITLSAATHKANTPWHITWELTGGNADIPDDLIENFYRDLLASPKHSSL